MIDSIDPLVRHELATALGYLAGDYDTWFARGKILAWKYHLDTADKLMQVFDIRMLSNPDTLTTATPNEEEN